ncbi:MAG: endo alpha-1,4 polygalactosaminidase [bacterium]|nr:endo alpha-1,4 polygalactosaminidase [bacterium]
MKRISFLLSFITSIFLFSLPVNAVEQNALNNIDSWVYQLQDANIKELSETDYDLVVIDYAKDGTDDTAYTRKQIKRLRDSCKIVLAYFSIGEAEDYRFYWQDEWNTNPPAWLGNENPNWQGNYKVKYWMKGWWNKGLLPYLERIEAAGFDGVYLDIIDSYEYWSNHGYSTKVSANRMARVVKKIRTNLNTTNDPIVCPQNGEAIIDDASKKYRRKYWNSIDCIGVEDLFYHSTKSDRKYRKTLFKRFAIKDKLILNVEYLKKSKTNEYLNKTSSLEFPVIPYRAHQNRDLDTVQ